MTWLRRTAIIAVIGLFARGAKPSCVSIAWMAPGDDGNYGTCARYEVRYATVPLNESNWRYANRVEYTPSALPSGGEQYLPVGGLTPGVKYHIAVRAVDERKNMSGITEVFVGVAPEDQCMGVTGNVDCDPHELIDISDLTRLIDYLYVSRAPICCFSEGNVDGDPYGNVDVADLTALIQILFSERTPEVCL
jgi:hypothetical protein